MLSTLGNEKDMWEDIKEGLNTIEVKDLGYDHLLCFGILDDSSEPFNAVLEESRENYKEPIRKF